MRLTDHLAARRRLYHRPLPTLPDILLIDIPADYAGTALPLDRYYPVILETSAELAEMEAFLTVRRTKLVVPDLFDRRPSALRCEDILFARYAPPEAGWPWGLLCCWPPAFTAMVSAGSDTFARAAYTVEFFNSVNELDGAEAQILHNLGPHEARQIRPMPSGIGHS